MRICRYTIWPVLLVFVAWRVVGIFATPLIGGDGEIYQIPTLARGISYTKNIPEYTFILIASDCTKLKIERL